jgi:predicted SAM-dependent methyltransferase
MVSVLVGHFAALATIVARWPRFARFVEEHLLALHREIEWERADREGRKTAVEMLEHGGRARIELGSAHFRRDGWLSLDIVPGADARVDLRRGLPFPDDSVEEVHAEHVFEHLEYPGEIMPLLAEVHRVLVVGGMLSFSVPNFRPYASAYVGRQKTWLEERIYDRPEGIYDDTELDLLSWFALRAGDHRYLYDAENTLQRLRDAGFVDVATRDFDDARDYNPRASSVYVMGRKGRA